MKRPKFHLFLSVICSIIVSCSNVENEKYVVISTGLFQEAQADFTNEDYSNSILKFSLLIKEYPKHFWLYHRRGQAYRANGEFEKALEDFALVIEKDRENRIQALLNSGLIYQKNLKNLERAKWFFKEIIVDKNPPIDQGTMNEYIYESTIGSAYHYLGRIAFEESDFLEAIDLFTKSLEFSGSHPSLYYRANAHFKAGNEAAALSDYMGSIREVKRHYVLDFPNSIINQCDTCGFPFGTEEYLALADYESEKFKKASRNRLEGILSGIAESPNQFLDSALKNDDSSFIMNEDTFYKIGKKKNLPLDPL